MGLLVLRVDGDAIGLVDAWEARWLAAKMLRLPPHEQPSWATTTRFPGDPVALGFVAATVIQNALASDQPEVELSVHDADSVLAVLHDHIARSRQHLRPRLVGLIPSLCLVLGHPYEITFG